MAWHDPVWQKLPKTFRLTNERNYSLFQHNILLLSIRECSKYSPVQWSFCWWPPWLVLKDPSGPPEPTRRASGLLHFEEWRLVGRPYIHITSQTIYYICSMAFRAVSGCASAPWRRPGAPQPRRLAVHGFSSPKLASRVTSATCVCRRSQSRPRDAAEAGLRGLWS